MLFIQVDVCHLYLASMHNFATDMANVENVQEMLGTREVEVAAAVATESGGAVATESGGGRQLPAMRWLVTRLRRPVG